MVASFSWASCALAGFAWLVVRNMRTQVESMTTLYIAGPMSGLPEFNYPAFHSAAEELRQLGFEVVSPAELHDGDTSRPWDFYMRASIAALVGCDGVALLPDWRKSRGARLEVSIADALKMPVRLVELWRPM